MTLTQMAYNDHLMPKLFLIIVGVNLLFQNVRLWTLVTTRNGCVPSVRVCPRLGHELPDSSP
jgi:hypothetical protein